MKKYKGFNVPNVGEFVSAKKDITNITSDYCIALTCWTPQDGYIYKCSNNCIFSNASDKTILDWHNARLKGVNGES